MLKFFTRKRSTPQPQRSIDESLRIGNLLDHPALQHVMSIDLGSSTLVSNPTELAGLSPLVEVHFERRQLLEVAA